MSGINGLPFIHALNFLLDLLNFGPPECSVVVVCVFLDEAEKESGSKVQISVSSTEVDLESALGV